MTTNKQLRELAEKAGVQEWGQDKGDVVALGGWPGSSGPLVLASANEYFPDHALNTAAYVAAANPATILALLEAYEALQAECEKLRKDAIQYRRLIELGEDFQWENIIRVDISDFPSRADAIDAVMRDNPC